MIWFYQAIGSIRDFMELGGNVLWAIMFVLFLMWTFILERLWYFYRVYPARRSSILAAWESRPDTTSWYARRIREGLVSETSLALKQNVGLIKVLIAICPLLGLLGTVTGMIAVFDVMTYSGGWKPNNWKTCCNITEWFEEDLAWREGMHILKKLISTSRRCWISFSSC